MARPILPEPPDELKRHSERLCERIRAAIGGNGHLPFSRYMEMALYEPGLGYYSAGLHKLGRGGDFVTAPELGTLFAACLARLVIETGASLTGEYDVLEIGAGSGKLAADLLGHLPPGERPARYRILERSGDLRQVQRERIEREVPDWIDRVEWLDAPPEEAWQGLLIANEVIDALAAERFQVTQGRVEQLGVQATANRFDWAAVAAPEPLERAVRHLEQDTGRPFADGYRSEIHLRLEPWLQSLTERLSRGLALFIDYGYARDEFYLPERRDGTLMCHYRHRAHDDPFFWPGLQDITTWVDFTALAEAADACGLGVDGYTSQSMFLVGCGLEQVLQEKMSDTAEIASLSAEARQLTMPGLMGDRFKVMGLGRGLDREPAAFSPRDLRYRL